MSIQVVDFKRVANLGLQVAQLILSDIVPGGTVVGKEYIAGGVTGGKGRSFSFNLESGLWKDFATGQKGGDVISLYAESQGVQMLEAAKIIQDKYIGNVPTQNYPTKKPQVQIIKPPQNATAPSIHPNNKRWIYRDIDGSPLFYVVRGLNTDIHPPEKFYYPLSFSSEGKWVKKHYTNPTLYNLHKIHNDKTYQQKNKNGETETLEKWIVVCEGEKAADAAEKILGSCYVATTWPAGVNNWNKCDWNPLTGRKVLLWPDADDINKETNIRPGIHCMTDIYGKLVGICKEIKLIDPTKSDKAGGWDAADALEEGWDFKKFAEWAKPLIHNFVAENKPVATMGPVNPPAKMDVDGKRIESDELLPDDELYTPSNYSVDHADAKIIKSDRGTVIMNAANVAILLRYRQKGLVWRDTFYNDNLTMYKVPPGYPPRAWTDADTIEIMVWLQAKFGLAKIAKNHVEDGINYFACLDVRNEPQDWLNSLEWDQKPRINKFFHRAMQAEDSEWSTAVSKNFWIALVARVLSPGCQVDEMVVLESKQGTRKTSALRAIAGRWYGEVNADLRSKDFDQSLQGKILVEFGELAELKKSDVELVKRKITSTVDQYRPSYGRKTEKFPRTCIFTGSTNDDRYLIDPTGNRRFNPLPVGNSDMQYIIENREQLFAEAVMRYKSGESWWVYPQKLADDMRESRMAYDIWMEQLSDLVTSPRMQSIHLTTSDIYRELGGTLAQADKKSANRIASCMRILGYRTQKMTFQNGKRMDAWVKIKEPTTTQEGEQNNGAQ